MAVSITIREAPQNRKVLEDLRALPERAKKNLRIAMDRILLNVLRDSKTEPPRVPVDTGALQSTGHVEPATIHERIISGAVVYGGFAGPPYNIEVDYAVTVHENMNAHYHR